LGDRLIVSCLSFIHCKGVFHCDFSCRNVFVTKQYSVKIGDFGGLSLHAHEPLTAEEPCYELPLRGRSWEARPYRKKELFALGCELMAWKKRLADLCHNQVEK
jgi:serine/threonine protein kinase